MNKFIHFLEKQLKQELPGFDAQKIMTPSDKRRLTPAEDSLYSAVNLITFFDNDKFSFILIKRTNNLQHHSGQIALPGGQFDKTDNDLLTTAIRETYEEIGIRQTKDNFIGKLSPVFIEVSNFLVQPFVSFLYQKPKIKINETEVKKIYITNARDFLSDNNIFTGKIKLQNKCIIAPYFKLHNEKVWGATAMMLYEFKIILQKIDFF